MGHREDHQRFKKIGEEKRQDLSEFIQHGEIQAGDDISIPIKIIDLPSFEYDKGDKGGFGKGEGDVGDPVPVDNVQPQPGDGDEDGEAGESEGEHGHYEMDPEEFAEELDEELGLDLEPKGKQVKTEKEGPYVELARSGPESTLDFERMYKKGLKRTLAMFFDEDYVREVMKVDGMGERSVFEWAREQNLPVSEGWIEEEYKEIDQSERTKYESIDHIDLEFKRQPTAGDVNSVALRAEDKRHKYPKITKEYERNAVVVFIRDVSGSMSKDKRELVERIFTPIDWYLTGKYDNAEFVYIAHDADAWEVDRSDFFGIKSGGGTRISSAYELAQEILETRYDWREWNRYVFGAGDGENFRDDTKDNVIPLLENIDANLHGYVEVSPSGHGVLGDSHKDVLENEIGDKDNVATYLVKNEKDVMDCIYELLSTEDNDE